MGGLIELEFVSVLAAEPGEVWRVVATMEGVNAELHPFLHMTSPRALRSLPSVATPGRVLFRSWLLLFGVLPFDLHSLALTHVDDGSRFVEDSTSWLQRRWHHERTLRGATGGGCLVRDRLVIEPRLGPVRPIVAAVVELLFAHRHRRLRKRFGVGLDHDG